jgi:hypothetical protein
MVIDLARNNRVKVGCVVITLTRYKAGDVIVQENDFGENVDHTEIDVLIIEPKEPRPRQAAPR